MGDEKFRRFARGIVRVMTLQLAEAKVKAERNSLIGTDEINM